MTIIATLEVELKTNDERLAAERAWQLADKLTVNEPDVENVRVPKVE